MSGKLDQANPPPIKTKAATQKTTHRAFWLAVGGGKEIIKGRTGRGHRRQGLARYSRQAQAAILGGALLVLGMVVSVHAMKYLWIFFWASLFLIFPALAGEKFEVGPASFEIAEGWLKKPGRGMVKATLMPGEKGPALKFYYFGGGQGGDVGSNVRRWKGQFKGEVKGESKEKEINGRKVTIVDFSGTYLDGPPMARVKVPKEGYRMLGAIIPDKNGPIFLKMTGPKAEMADAEEGFEAILNSLKY